MSLCFYLLVLINLVGHSHKRVDIVVGLLETSIVGNQILIKLNVQINFVAVTHIGILKLAAFADVPHICATERLA